LKGKTGLIWIGGVVLIGLILGFMVQSTVNAANHLVTVYVAARDIAVDTVVQQKDVKKELRPATYLPADAIKDPNQVVGKYTATAILSEQVVKQRAVTDAATLRQMIRRFGLNFVGMTLPVDQSDISLTDIFPGDTIDILGTFTEGQNVIRTRYVAENVPVTAIDQPDKKIMLALAHDAAPEVARDLAAGKLRIVLDPRAFDKQLATTTVNNGQQAPSQAVGTQSTQSAPSSSTAPSTATVQKAGVQKR